MSRKVFYQYSQIIAGLLAPVVVTALLTSGCGQKNGATVRSTGDQKSSATSTHTPATGPLKDMRFFAYQIQGQEEDGSISKLAASRYDLLVIDQVRSVKGQEGYDSKADVSRLKTSLNSVGGPRSVICYIDVGEAESYRTYWRDGWRVGNPEWIVATDPDGWDGNYPVKFWREDWKKIVRARLDQIIDDGYSGIYLDWLEAYSFQPVARAARSEGRDLQESLYEFVRDLADYARARKPGFILIAQNAAEMGQMSKYASLFDAIAQESVWYTWGGDPDTGQAKGDIAVNRKDSQWLIDDLSVWQEQGRPVMDIEYAQKSDNAAKAYRLGAEHGFKTYVTLSPLDALSGTPPPGLPSR